MAGSSDNRYRFPWREGNRFELLVDGENFFPAMLHAIDLARHQVLLEIYLIESGQVAERFVRALCHAAERGVEVCLLLDDFGARGLHHHALRKLRDSGVNLAFYNPLRYGQLRRNLLRDHRKLLCIDNHLAFTGGTGITDEFDSHPTHRAWHEVMVAIRGPVVADWQQLFLENWRRWNTTPLLWQAPAPPPRGNAAGRLAPNSPVHADIQRSLINRLRGAERRIWIATAYFLPSRKIRRLLRRAAKRGVDVRLLLPGPHTDHPAVRHAGRRFYSRLLRNGVRIYEYQPRFLHTKLLLCDDQCSIGSSNIDRWNLRWNLEANQEIACPEVAGRLAELFRHDFAQSHEILSDNWYRRPWHRRLLEWFWGAVDMWVDRRSQGRRHKDD